MSSTLVDERIVEMQFDNKNFEKNVQESMNTIDKLNKKLKFDESKDAFSNLSKDAKKFDLSSINNAVDAVKVRFSGMQMAFNAAIQEIVHTAFSAGKQIVDAIAIRPIKTGLQEYETYMGSIQTILSNTRSKGTVYSDVTESLDELNTYADKTIYNFTQMTKNIGTFTAAGVDLKTATAAIKGIANLAAVSGSNAEQANRAMYNLSQALSMGTLKLIDWNSVVNAGMGGEIFQEELKATAKQLRKTSEEYDYDVDAIIKKRGSFRESLRDGWVNTEVLTKTLAKFTGDMTEAQLRLDGYAQDEIDRIIALGKDANDAATKVKSLSQLFDTLNEALQSGWAMSWRLIVGDFYQARDALTQISNVVGNMISTAADKRNEYLRTIFGGDWDKLVHRLGDDEKGLIDRLKIVATSASEETGESFERLLKRYSTAEEAVQEAIRRNMFDVDDLKYAIIDYANELMKMSDEEREIAGVSKEQFASIKKLRHEIYDGTFDVKEFVNNLRMDKSSARENIVEAVWRGLKMVMSYINPIKKAFADTFLPGADAVWKFTRRIRDMFKNLMLSNTQADKFYRIIKGLLAPIKIIISIIGKMAKAFGNVFRAFTNFDGDDILEFFAKIGDRIVDLSDRISKSDAIQKFFEKIFTAVATAIGAIGLFIDNVVNFVKNSPAIQRVFENVRNFFTDIWEWIQEKAPIVIDGLEKLWEKLSGIDWRDKIEQALGKIVDWFSNLKTNVLRIIDDIKSKFQAFSDWFVNSKIMGYITNMAEAFRNIGADTLNKTSNFFGGVIPDVSSLDNLSRFEDILLTILGVIATSLIPSMVFIRDWADSLKYFVEVVMDTLEEIAPRIGPMLLSIFTSIGDYLTANKDSIKAIVVDLVGIAIEAAVETTPMLVDGFMRMIKGVFDALAGRLPEIISSFKSFLETVLPTIRDMVVAALKVAALIAVIRIFKSIKMMFEAFKDTLSVMDEAKNKTGGGTNKLLRNIAFIIISLAALIAAISILAKQFANDSNAAGSAMIAFTGITVIITGIAGLMALMAKDMTPGDVKSMAAMAGTFAILSGSLTSLLGSVAILSAFDSNKIWNATGVVAVLAVLMGGLFAVVNIAAKQGANSGTSSKKMAAYAGIVGMLTGFLVKLAEVVAVLSIFNQDKLKTAAAVVVILGGVVSGLLYSFIGAMKLASGMHRASMNSFIAAIGVMTGCVATLGLIVAALAALPQNNVATAAGIVAILGGIVVGLLYSLNGITKTSSGMDMAGLALTLGMMSMLVSVVGAITIALAQLKPAEAVTGVAALAVELGVLVGFIASLNALAKSGYSEKVSLVLLALGVALTGLGISMVGLGAGFVLVVKGLKDLSKISGREADVIVDNLKKLTKGFIELIPDLALALGEASATIVIGLGKHSHEIAIALTKLLVDAIWQLNEELPQIISGLMELAIKSLDLLTKYSPVLIAKLFEFLHVVLRGLIEKIPELMKDLVDLVAAVFKGLSDAFEAVDPQVWGHGLNAITYLGGLVTYLASFGPMIPLAFASAVELGILIEELAGIMWLIGKSFGGDKALDTVNKGGDVLEGIGRGIGRFLGGIVTGAIDQLPAIAQQLSSFASEIQPFIDAMAGVDPSSLTGAEMLASVIKTFAETGFIETASGVATGLAAFFTGGVSLIGTGTGTKSVLDNFTEFCEDVGEGLSTFSSKTKDVDVDTIGVATRGLKTLAEAYEALPVLARNNTASDFMENLAGLGEAMSGFIDKMKGVSSADATSASASAKAVTDFIGGMPDLQVNYGEIASWGADGTGNIGDFKNGLVGLADSLAAFGQEAKDIKPGLVTRGVEAADSMYEMIDKYIGIRNGLDGFWNTGSGFKGFNDSEKGLGVFAQAIAAFGRASTEIDSGLVQRGSEAGVIIGKALDALANFPQFVAMLSGEGLNINDPELFKKTMGGLASGIAEFSTNASGIDEHAGSKARIISNVVKFLSDAPIESSKGMIKWLVEASDADLDSLQNNLPKLALGLVQFSGYALGVTDTAHMIAVAVAGKSIATMLDEFPDDLTAFENDVEAFSHLGELGQGLADFSSKIAEVSSTQLVLVGSAAKVIVDVVKTLSEFSIGADAIKNRSEAVAVFGTKMSSFYEDTKDIQTGDLFTLAWALDAVIGSIEKATMIDPTTAENLVGALAGLGNASFQGFIDEFGEARQAEAKQAVTNLINAAAAGAKETTGFEEAVAHISNQAVLKFDDYSDEFTAKGESLASYVADGLRSEAAVATAKTGVNSMVQQVLGGIRTKYQSFHNAGEFLARGFANGISGSGYLASSAAYKIGANAVSSLRSGAGVASPSIYGYEAGMFLGQGFVNGMVNMSRDITTEATNMGTSAVQAMNQAIANMSSELDAQLDTQPVIRPVLDLSNVQSRSHMLTSLLSRDQAMLIGANVNNEKALEIQNGLKVPEPGDNYSFVQNNYSPKALSRIEIYRQTKNQFSAMKGLATES